MGTSEFLPGEFWALESCCSPHVAGHCFILNQPVLGAMRGEQFEPRTPSSVSLSSWRGRGYQPVSCAVQGNGQRKWGEEGKYSTKEKSLFSLFAFVKESKRLMIIKGKLRHCIARCGVSAPWDVLQAVLCLVWARRCCGTELNPSTVSPPVPREVLICTCSKEGSITHILRVPESTKLGVEITRRCPRVCVKEIYSLSSCCEEQMPGSPCPVSQLNCLLLHSL